MQFFGFTPIGGRNLKPKARKANEMGRSKAVVSITLADAGSPTDVPFDNRLRRLLKAMLRGYGLRAIRVADVPEPERPEFELPAIQDAETGQPGVVR